MKKSNLPSSLTSSLFASICLVGFAACEKKTSAPEEAKVSNSSTQISSAAIEQKVEANQPGENNSKVVSIPPQSLINPQQVANRITNIKISGSDLSFTSTGRDPYFSFPWLDSMPNGAVVKVDITLPEKQMLQLFYQRTGDSAFTEENSLRAVKKGGRQTIEWKIKDSLNGSFRLDPGTTTGDYIIHKVEVIY
jgi:uncharacterized membrane protein YfhO